MEKEGESKKEKKMKNNLNFLISSKNIILKLLCIWVSFLPQGNTRFVFFKVIVLFSSFIVDIVDL